MKLNLHQAVAKILFMSAFTVMPMALFKGSLAMFFLGLGIFILSIFTFRRTRGSASGPARVRSKKINHPNLKRRLHV